MRGASSAAQPAGADRQAFAKTYGIRLCEIGHHMPPPAVRADLKVIEAEPEVLAKAVDKVFRLEKYK